MLATDIKTIDLIPSGLPLRLYCDQGDISDGSNGRLFMLALQKGGVAYGPATGATASIEGTKPDGSTFTHTLTLAYNIAYISLYEDMTDISGNVKMQIVVKEGNNRTGSQLIILFVQRSAYNGNNSGI